LPDDKLILDDVHDHEAAQPDRVYLTGGAGHLDEALRPRLGEAAVRAEATRSLAALLDEVNGQLVDDERLRMLVVAREPWSMENGRLTPTMKIKQARIESGVADRVERWSAQAGPVAWG